MRIPLDWLQKYIKLEHTPEEFGDIMTKLEFMQDGPIEEVAGQKVVDLETRQNRPDSYAVIGIAREYAAYINKKIKLPPQKEKFGVEWGTPENNLQVNAPDIVKRFCTVEINGLKIKESPDWLKRDLEAYGIPPINNLVDITNYVMLEYGTPLHAMDYRKLQRNNESATIVLRRAKQGENFVTWQGTELNLTTEDLVVCDAEKPVAIAGIIGSSNSGIDNKTKHIILESATYEQSFIRRTSIRHSIRTDASTRHEKFLNPAMVEIAIKRALYLIEELCEGEIIKIEDYYENRYEPVIVEFNTNEVQRLGGVDLDKDEIISLLERLEFEIIDQKDAIGIGNQLQVKVPMHRTDINYEADLVEEVMRLWGYDRIPMQPITSSPTGYSTPVRIQLQDKFREILTSLGLNEYITLPFVTYTNKQKQIKIENPLNKELNALRMSIRETLQEVVENYKKSQIEKVGVFEVGKAYFEEKKGKYIEEERVSTLYSGYEYKKVKGDFLSVIHQLGLNNNEKLKVKEEIDKLVYLYDGTLIAELYVDGYVFFVENIVPFVDIHDIPHYDIKTKIPQRIVEELALVMNKSQRTGVIVETLHKSSDYISDVEITDVYEGNQIPNDKKSVTFKITFEDENHNLTQELVDNIKESILKSLSKEGIELRQ